MHYAVHRSLLSGSAGCLLRTGRVVEPYVHALYEPLGQGDVVARNEYDLAEETRLLAYLDDLADEVLTCAVGRVGLACEHELNRMLRVVDYGVETVKVAEEQGRTLVGGETAGETYGEHVVAEVLLDLDDLARRIVAAEHRVGETFAYDSDELLLERQTGIPYFLIGDVVDAGEAAHIIVMGLEFRTEHLVVDGLPFLGAPGWIVDAVGHIAHVQLLRQIARVHIGEYLLADLAVKHGHAVDLLGDVGGQDAH